MILKYCLLTLSLIVVVGCGDRGGESSGSGGSQAASSRAITGLFAVGGHQLYLVSRGVGRPAVVVDAGFGNPSETWAPIQNALAGSTQVILRDRAEYGRSESGPLPRDADKSWRIFDDDVFRHPVTEVLVVIGPALVLEVEGQRRFEPLGSPS